MTAVPLSAIVALGWNGQRERQGHADDDRHGRGCTSQDFERTCPPAKSRSPPIDDGWQGRRSARLVDIRTIRTVIAAESGSSVVGNIPDFS